MPPTTRTQTEQGSISIFVAVLATGFLMAAGLALDGGRKLGGLSEARDLADNAARTCSQAVDSVAFRDTGTPILDPSEAVARANAYLGSVGHSGTITVVGPECTVTVALTIPTRFLPGPFNVSATESARALAGVEGAIP